MRDLSKIYNWITTTAHKNIRKYKPERVFFVWYWSYLVIRFYSSLLYSSFTMMMWCCCWLKWDPKNNTISLLFIILWLFTKWKDEKVSHLTKELNYFSYAYYSLGEKQAWKWKTLLSRVKKSAGKTFHSGWKI